MTGQRKFVPKRKLGFLDRLRGWHWRAGVQYRNMCGCPLKEA